MPQEIDYTQVEIPEDESPENYHYTARRAEILQLILKAGSPSRMRQADLADRYDVDQSTISRDMDRIAEHVDEALGDRAKLTTRATFQRVVDELLEEEDWRAKKAAWDVVMDWNDWLADIGEQHREPDEAKVDMDVDARSTEVSYTVVRGGDEGELPTDNNGRVDYDDLGFTKAPATIEITDSDEEDNQ